MSKKQLKLWNAVTLDSFVFFTTKHTLVTAASTEHSLRSPVSGSKSGTLRATIFALFELLRSAKFTNRPHI